MLAVLSLVNLPNVLLAVPIWFGSEQFDIPGLPVCLYLPDESFLFIYIDYS